LAAGADLPPSLYTTLHFSPSILLSIQDHLRAFTIRHIKQLLLRRLLNNILRILFYVFHEVLYPKLNSIYIIFHVSTAVKTVFCLFILLLSKRRLKASPIFPLELPNIKLFYTSQIR